MTADQHVDVAIVGGGIIGLAVAWRARERGMSVSVFERDELGRGASYVAAGMLAPVAELEFGQTARRVLEMGLRSAQMWPAFADELRDATGVPIALRRTGTLLVARDEDGARELERQLELRRSLGLPVERLLPSEAREREPSLAPTVRLALEAPDDHAVDPRPVLKALRRVCEHAGVVIHEHTSVRGIELDGACERVRGLRLHSGELVSVDRVVLAAGAWTEALGGLPAHAQVPVRPVKGQIMRLREPVGAELLTRVVRFEGGYLLPRGDGRYVLGATVEERGFEFQPTVQGVYELLRDAHELVPGISELELVELSVGLRPGTPDNAPVLGPGALEGLVWASGHYRHGILLAPLTAELILGVLDSALAPPDAAALLAACDPTRFSLAEALP
jgi:glycine oxidase